jgi:hypothetical protein
MSLATSTIACSHLVTSADGARAAASRSMRQSRFVVDFEGDKISRARTYLEPSDALTALGLSE